jgi:hypothetical protein
MQQLTVLFNSLSRFVTVSILSASVSKKSLGIEVAERWLAISRQLRNFNNYHLLMAIQTGLAKHQCDRQSWLWSGLSAKWRSEKEALDAMFDPNTRMEGAVQSIHTNIGQRPLIPCTFWLVQKAQLLKETPVFLDDGTINTARIRAASNIYQDMIAGQKCRYSIDVSKMPEELLWYFLRLERGVLQITEDELYSLSDAAKNQNSGTLWKTMRNSGGRDRSSSAPPSPTKPRRSSMTKDRRDSVSFDDALASVEEVEK